MFGAGTGTQERLPRARPVVEEGPNLERLTWGGRG